MITFKNPISFLAADSCFRGLNGSTRARRFISGLSLIILLGGCSLDSSSITVPEIQTPESWVSSLPEGAEGIAARELAVWWTQFGDETLTNLVDRSLSQNLDLLTAVARVEEALALRAIAAGERVPGLTGNGAVLENRLSDFGGAAFGPRDVTFYTIGVDASWELDLWGRIRKSVAAADSAAQASLEDMRGVRALIASQVASNYIALREIQLRQRLSEENVQRQKQTLVLTKGRFMAGLVPKLDVDQAELNLARTEAVLPLLHQFEGQTLRALDVLAGLPPGELDSILLAEALPVPLPENVKLHSLPADVLRRRPDLRAAEQRFLAAAARVGVAEAELYPRISLSGSFAWEASESGDLFNSNSLATSYGPSFLLPIFQGGRLRAQVTAAESRALQAELSFKQGILRALQEVENALKNYQQEQLRRKKLNEGVAAAQTTVVQVHSLYENGLVDFLNVLDAERNLAAIQDEAAASLGKSSRDLVAVYRALGGGWDDPESPTL